MSLIRFLALLMCLTGASGVAHAGCTLAAAQIALGSATTYDVRDGRSIAATGPAGLSCAGSIVSIGSGNSARATATSASGFRLRDGAGNPVLRYRLSADPGGRFPLGSGGTVEYFDPALISLLGILSTNSFAPTLYAAVADTPNLAPGIYTDTVTIDWNWQVCYGVGLGLGGTSLCVLGEADRGSVTVTITLTVTKDCRVAAPDIVFAPAALASGFVPVSQAVAVDCSLGTSFTIAFTAGDARASRPWRAMIGPRDARLEYNIFRPDGTVWDEGNPLSGRTGTGNTATGQLHSYTARINPAQADPVAGSYADTISVVVTF